jgi:trehalose 6-phosphate phosphatase
VDPAALLAPLARVPERSALILDVDGTLAPIAVRPELARVPDETRREMRRLATRYLLVACLSGRPGADAAALVGVEGVRYVGNHGLELRRDARQLAETMARFRDEIDSAWPIEDKGLTLSFHYREAADESAAVETLEGIAARARERGLDPRWGRKVLEVRPAVAGDKGTAVRTLLEESAARLGLYAGDDATDVDAFRGLVEAGLEHAVRIAVSSAEAPCELIEEADLAVDDPAALVALLHLL